MGVARTFVLQDLKRNGGEPFLEGYIQILVGMGGMVGTQEGSRGDEKLRIKAKKRMEANLLSLC